MWGRNDTAYSTIFRRESNALRAGRDLHRTRRRRAPAFSRAKSAVLYITRLQRGPFS